MARKITKQDLEYKYNQVQFFLDKINNILENVNPTIDIFYYSDAYVQSIIGLINHLVIFKDYNESYFNNKQDFRVELEYLKNNELIRFIEQLRDKLFHLNNINNHIIINIKESFNGVSDSPTEQLDFAFDYSILDQETISNFNRNDLNGIALLGTIRDIINCSWSIIYETVK